MEMKIDIDTEKVLLEGTWYSVDELKETIKEKVENGDFDVADYAAALKKLESELGDTEEFTIKLPSIIAEKVRDLADEKDATPGSIIRSILSSHFEVGGEVEPPAVGEDESESTGDTEVDEIFEESGGETFEYQEEEPQEESEEEEPPEEEEEPEEDKPKVIKVQCPRCGTTIVVDNPQRPLTIVCPNCGNRGKITK